MGARVLGAIQMARAADGITHSGVRGRVREILIKELFKPLLPSHIGISSGQIIACKSGKLSREQDIIIYDKSLLPAMDFDADTAIVPIESVLYTIEIKSRLTKAELVSADSSAGELTEFDYLPSRTLLEGREVLHASAKLNSVIFALDSDLVESEHGEVQRYKEIYNGRTPHLKALCVAGRGYWYESRGSWVKIGGELEFDEILAFISGVMNTYGKVSKSRGYFPIGEYLIKPGNDLRTFPSGTAPTLIVECEHCNDRAVVSFPTNAASMQTWADGYVGQDNCDRCGGRRVAAAGTYMLREGRFEKQPA